MHFSSRQLQIIEKAMMLIDHGGIQNLTTKNLALEMGFSEPALYRHFKNKTEILNSVLIHYQSVLKEGMESSIMKKLTGLEQILNIINFQLQKFADQPAIIMVIFSEASFQNNSELQETVRNIISEKQQRIDMIIKKGQEDKSIRSDVDSMNLTHILMGALRFTALRWKLSGYKFSLENESELLQKSIKTMIKPI